VVSRINNVLTQIPKTQTLTASTSLAVSNGYPRITGTGSTLSTTITGTADGPDFKQILVNGVAVTPAAVPTPSGTGPAVGNWTASNVPLYPGLNHILVQAM